MRMYIRAGQGMLGRYFPHFRRVRAAFHALRNGRGRECVGGGTRQRLTTLFPKLGAVLCPRDSWVSWVERSTSSRLKCVTFLDAVHDRGISMNGMVLSGDARLRRQQQTVVPLSWHWCQYHSSLSRIAVDVLGSVRWWRGYAFIRDGLCT